MPVNVTAPRANERTFGSVDEGGAGAVEETRAAPVLA
jgi:hypothetical protein